MTEEEWKTIGAALSNGKLQSAFLNDEVRSLLRQQHNRTVEEVERWCARFAPTFSRTVFRMYAGYAEGVK